MQLISAKKLMFIFIYLFIIVIIFIAKDVKLLDVSMKQELKGTKC